MSNFVKNILCIGAGYVGGPTMAVIADQCPEYRVTVVDVNAERIAAWQSERLPIYEPGLDEVVNRARGRNLFFSTDIPAAIKAADMVFVSVNTPTKTYGHGAGQAADLQYWEKTARTIRKHATRDLVVIEKSTLPVRTAAAMARILNVSATGCHFEVLSNPEFLAEGTAIRDLEAPARVLVGSQQTPGGLAAAEELLALYAHWVPRERILTTNLWSSELSKLAANAFLAQRVSSINSIATFCEETGADVTEVARAIGMDARIGSRFLQAGVGFGGSCFEKDILNLVYLSRHYGLGDVADYWEQVVRYNDYQKRRLAERLLESMFNTVSGKRVAVFGFAFKANTGDTRKSPAIDVCRQLAADQAELAVSDPQALDNARRDLADLGDRVTYEPDPYVAAAGAHALAVLTEWDCYRELDYRRVYLSMEQPAVVFDGRNILDHQRLFEIGFDVYAIGKPPWRH